MGKKRKSRSGGTETEKLERTQYPINETFDDSEDEFYAHRDKILIDEAPAAKRRRKLEERYADLQPSDEEVFEDANGGHSDEDDEVLDDDVASGSEEDPDTARRQSEDEEDERFWGTERKDYYNADLIETEADALEEEAEAHRLQQKQLKSMTEADFGFDESEWANYDKVIDPGRPVVEKLPPVQIPENATTHERLVILRTRYPEFEPLAQDLVALSPTLDQLKIEVAGQQQSQTSRALETEPRASLTKLRALSAYLASIAVYMAVLTSTKDGLALPPAEIRDHPVMATLLRCRQLWDAVEDLEDTEVVSEEPEQTASPPPAMMKKAKVPKQKEKVPNGLSMEAVEKASSSKSKKEKAVETLNDDDDYEALPPTKPIKSRSKKSKHTDLQDLLSQAATATPLEDPSNFGDEAPLTQEEAAEKAKKKRSLRFYTSQIAQKANKRGAAGREAGGDDDVPYKERIRDKQDRLMREAAQRAQATQPSMDDSDDGDEVDVCLRDKVNAASNDYYNSIVSKSAQKKNDKAAKADAYALATQQNATVYETEQVGADGKRKITYAIEKNKGLTPRRKKEVRNPRVKKKMKYEAKMKKLGSMKPTWKGGEGRGGYKGELTGIKTNVVKSTKL